MTPEQRRAKAITDEISAGVRQRRNPAILDSVQPHVEKEPASKTGHYLLFALVAVALHASAFLGYQAYSKAQDAKAEAARAAILADALAQAEQARIEAQRMLAAFAKTPHPTFTLPAGTNTTTPNTQPRIDYNVYKDPRPAPKPVRPPTPPPPPVQESTTAPAPSSNKAAVIAAHQNAAITYLMKKSAWNIRITKTEPIPGWENRYRVEGEAYFTHYGTKTPSPRRFDVFTEPKNGIIQGVDYNVKW